MKKRLLPIITIVVILASLLFSALPVGAAVTPVVVDQHGYDGNFYTSVWTCEWSAGYYTASDTYLCYGVNLYGIKEGTAVNVTASLRLADSNNLPTGSDLAYGTTSDSSWTTNTWHYVAFSTPYLVEEGTKYSVVCRSDAITTNNCFRWEQQGTQWVHSEDAGDTWSGTYNCDFQTMGVFQPDVSILAATSVLSTTVTLNASIDSMGGYNPFTGYFQYGLTTSYNNSTAHLSYTSTQTVSINVSYLQPDTTYHFRFVVYTIDGIVYSADNTFQTTDSPANGIIISTNFYELTPGTMQFNIIVSDFADSGWFNLCVEYGTSIDYGLISDSIHCVPGTGGSPLQITAKNPEDADYNTFFIEIDSLEPSTEYFYCYEITTDDGLVYDYGASSFTTSEFDPLIGSDSGLGRPTIVTSWFSSDATEEQILLYVPDMGTNPLTSLKWSYLDLTLQYGRSRALGLSTTTMHYTGTSTVSPFYVNSFTLSDLVENTHYYYRFKIGLPNNTTIYSAFHMFTTSTDNPVLYNRIVVTTGDATPASSAAGGYTAVLNGTITTMGNCTSAVCYFDIGADTAYGYQTVGVIVTEAGDFSFTTSNIFEPETTYHYRAKAQGNDFNGISYGDDDTFATSSGTASPNPITYNNVPPTMVTGTATDIKNTSVNLFGELTDLNDNTTAEVGIELFYINNSYYPAGTLNYPGEYPVHITDLLPNTTYKYRAYGICNGYYGYGEYKQFTTKNSADVVNTGTPPEDKINNWLANLGWDTDSGHWIILLGLFAIGIIGILLIKPFPGIVKAILCCGWLILIFGVGLAIGWIDLWIFIIIGIAVVAIVIGLFVKVFRGAQA